MTGKKTKILFFGMDGATWRILKPMFDAGRLPNLERLCEAGASGVLHSLEPMISPAIWTSIASGKHPEKHGVWDFVVSSKSVRCKRIWDIAHQNGLKVGLCGYMVTWPPPALEGFVIPGSFSRGIETHPASLQVIRELDMTQRAENKRSFFEQARRAWQSHSLGVRWSSFADAAMALLKCKVQKDPLGQFYQMRRIGMKIYTDVFIAQTRRMQPDLAMYLFTFVDSTSHNFWKFMEPERFTGVESKDIAKHAGKIPLAYELADRMIGRAVRALDRGDTTVMIVSDHGFQSIPEAQGRAPDRTVRILPEAIIALLGWEPESVRTFNIRGATFFRDRHEDQFQIQQMRTALEAISVEGSGARLFEVSLDPYGNIEIGLSREIGDLSGVHVRLPNDRVIAASEIVAADLGAISGDHHREGVIIAAGPGIRRVAELQNASVLDVTPTLLALMGLPVAKDMDGRVLAEMLAPEFLAARPARYIDTWEEKDWTFEEDRDSADEALKEQLRSLGYL